MIEVNCCLCKKEFLTYPSRIKIGRSKFCSHHCSALSRIDVLFQKGNKMMVGKKHSTATKEKIRMAHLGKSSINKSRSKMGRKNPIWKGGVSPINKRIRRSRKFFIWRKRVFERDDYTCQECGIRGKILHPHHLKPFATFPKLRFEISNGITLCESCHKKKHKLPKEQK